MSAALLIVAGVLGLSACGGDPQTPEPMSEPAWSPGAIPSTIELAEVQLTADDLDGDWAAGSGRYGVIVFCPDADAAAVQAADDANWQTEVLLDRTGDGTTSIMVDQFMMAHAPQWIEKNFNAMRDGTEACFGTSDMTEDGVVGSGEGATVVSEAMAVPEVGDDRFGESGVYPDGDPWTEGDTVDYYDLVLLRDGPVLMYIGISESTPRGSERQLSQDDIDRIVTTAAAKLP